MNTILSHMLAAHGIAASAVATMLFAYPPETRVATESVAIKVSSAAARPAARVSNRIDLALCLDTSGSMDGLLESAKQKLWDIVNNFALAEPTPMLRVALLTYGNDGYVSENGWVQVDTPFTDDLDEVSRQLFAKSTNGGTELVGRVINESLEQLDWTPGEDALKVIVVAGNESADQDQTFSYRQVCSASIARGIMVNAIYCGDIADTIAPGWREVAALADGHFSAIDQVNGNIVITTPFDDELVSLSSAINETYIPYGEVAADFAINQSAQDDNAMNQSAATAAQRCITKAGAMYKNSHWDLVDACREKVVRIEEVKAEDLPEDMRAMTVDERRAHVEQLRQQRVQIQKQVEALNVRRVAFVENERQKLAPGQAVGFDAAMLKALQSQAESKGFTFQKVAPPVRRDPSLATLELSDGRGFFTASAPVHSQRAVAADNADFNGTTMRFTIQLDSATSDDSVARSAFGAINDQPNPLVIEIESLADMTFESDLNAFAARVVLNGVEQETQLRVTTDPTAPMRYIVRGAIGLKDFGLDWTWPAGEQRVQNRPVLTFEVAVDLGC